MKETKPPIAITINNQPVNEVNPINN